LRKERGDNLVDNFKERIRAATRPVLLVLLIAGSWYFIAHGIEGAWVNSWLGLTIGAASEWILERPALKILNTWFVNPKKGGE
jgi:hypothetical protein